MPFRRVASGVYLVGGEGLTYPNDCLVYLVAGPPVVLIDTGANRAARRLLDNVAETGLDPLDITYCVLTHCHVDHIGGAKSVRDITSCALAAHEDDAEAIAAGDPVLTAANWYNLKLPKLPLDEILTGAEGEFGGLAWLHTPGHTPGSLALYLDTEDGRILFAQDVHGPFSPEFKSDLDAWRSSMEKLLALEADILCEGHFGVYRGKDEVARYIRSQLAAHAQE
ncbi:MAG: MBL fold metallo-hydrolase [Myxococcales bacterium]|nr:MBL fold metallo-hydrolase [Myxococcales bacterium]